MSSEQPLWSGPRRAIDLLDYAWAVIAAYAPQELRGYVSDGNEQERLAAIENRLRDEKTQPTFEKE